MEYNQRFPVLSTIAIILWIAGLVIGVVGAFNFGADALKAIQSHALEKREWAPGQILALVASFGILVYGLATMAGAEIIGVLFAIEKNTRDRAAN